MKKGLVCLLLIAVAGYWGYRHFFPSDEKQIRDVLTRASALAVVQPNEGNLQKIAAVRSLTGLCTEDVQLVLRIQGFPNQSIQGREQLTEALAGARAVIQSLNLTLSDVAVAVEKEAGEATAQFIARARVDQNPDEIVQEIKIHFRRVEGDWKIHRVEPLASLGI